MRALDFATTILLHNVLLCAFLLPHHTFYLPSLRARHIFTCFLLQWHISFWAGREKENILYTAYPALICCCTASTTSLKGMARKMGTWHGQAV